MVATATDPVEGARPFGAEPDGQAPLPPRQASQAPRQSNGWDMQATGTEDRPATSGPAAPPRAPDPLSGAAVATPIPETRGKFAQLWSNPKVRHGLVVAAGIVVIAVGVVLALLSGGGTPPGEELGASLAQAYGAYRTTSPSSSTQGSATTAPSTTTPSAAASAPVGDTITGSSSTRSSGSSSSSSSSEDPEPPGSLPQPNCPGTSPACGPFRWDATPAPNTPQLAPVWVSSVTPSSADSRIYLSAGQTLTVTVTADDPDAEFPSCWIKVTSTGAEIDAIQCTQEAKVLYPGEYGAHPVPAPVHGTAGPITIAATYPVAGDYVLEFTTTSGIYAQCGVASEVNCNPFGDSATVTIPITVT